VARRRRAAHGRGAVKAVVTGATGFLGRQLCPRLRAEGYEEVTALVRDPARARQTLGPGVECLAWDDAAVWTPAVAGADAVFHLAGESVAGERWTPEVKEKILRSRVETTRRIADAQPRGVLVSASAIGYYGGRGDRTVTEADPPGDDYLARVCIAWEDEARKAEATAARVVLLRIGVVLGKGGGALESMLNPPGVPFSPFKLGVGGPLGSGRQWTAWVHVEDVLGLLLHAAKTDAATGPVNAVAPNPVTNAQLSAAIGRALGRPAVVPVPAFAVRMVVGELADYLLYSQRVLPVRAQELGYRFRFPDIDSALRDIIGGP